MRIQLIFDEQKHHVHDLVAWSRRLCRSAGCDIKDLGIIQVKTDPDGHMLTLLDNDGKFIIHTSF